MAQERPSTARVVVAIDLGTTFSGFAYARKSEPDKVFKFYDWPYAGKAGAKPYCKTQTSLFYKCDSDGKFLLKEWGWRALVHFTQAIQGFKSTVAKDLEESQGESSKDRCDSDGKFFLKAWGWRALAQATHAFKLTIPKDLEDPQADSSKDRTRHIADNESEHVDLMNASEFITEKVGYFATRFKLFLPSEDADHGNRMSTQQLPGDLTTERFVVDYLRCISDFVMTELRLKYGQHFGKADVQWCVTVPAIWDERAKQMMKMCSQKAGLVKGPLCTTVDASPHALDIILEPEAASVYCQQEVREMKLRKGDKLLVADVGGGTIDLVVHMKSEDDPQSMKVEEAVGSYGTLGGGTFVDSHFFRFLCGKIGCFKQFCRENPSTALSILGWWQGIKMGFDGEEYSAELILPSKLSDAWKEHDRKMGNAAAEDYGELRLEDADIMRIFDEEVEKVLQLIEREVKGVRVLLVVGGFSASPYLRKKVMNKFGRRVRDIIIPEDPGSAICHGAVQLSIQKEIIQSRVSKRTYGVSMSLPAEPQDSREYVFQDDDGRELCNDRFDVFVRVGERVCTNQSVKEIYYPVERSQEELYIALYSSTSVHPRYTTEKECRLEGHFTIDISDGIKLGTQRSVEVTMCFGGSNIEVTAKRVNFGSRKLEKALSVTFSCD